MSENIKNSFKRFSNPHKYKFYVYVLIDPRNNNIFYIGKGTKNRIDQHEQESKKGVCSYKCNKIRSIEQSGFNIIKYKIAGFNDEKEAYDYETKIIDDYGLENLTNVMRGGRGAWTKRVNEYKSSKKKKEVLKEWESLLKNPVIFINWCKLTEFGKYRVKSIKLGASKLQDVISDIAMINYNECIPKLLKIIYNCPEQKYFFESKLKEYGFSKWQLEKIAA